MQLGKTVNYILQLPQRKHIAQRQHRKHNITSVGGKERKKKREK